MKKTSSILALLISLLAVSCSKKTDDATPADTPPVVTPTYYLNYKFNGTLISADSFSVMRNTSVSPKTLTITGMKKASPHLPMVQIVISESFIGWVDGLNVGCSSASVPDDMVTMTDAAGAGYSTATTSNGIDLFFSKLSYTQGNVIKGTLSGEVIKNSTSTVVPITEGTFNLLISN